MRKIILRIIGFLAFAVSLTVLTYIKFTKSSDLAFIVPIAAGLVVTMAMKPFIDSFYYAFLLTKPWKEKLYVLRKQRKIRKDEPIYVSGTILFRIRIGTKYFLVYSYRQEKYIILGRSYKIDDNMNEILKKCKGSYCYTYVCNGANNEFKVKIPQNRIDKFSKYAERIYDKEYVENRCLDAFKECTEFKKMQFSDIDDIKFNVVGRYYDGIRFSRIDQQYVLLVQDVVEVELNKKQQAELREYYEDPEFGGLFTLTQISKYGIDPDSGIFKATIKDYCERITTDFEPNLMKIKKVKKQIKDKVEK